MNKKKIILIGGGGHALSCIDVINLHKDFKILGYIDNEKKLKIISNFDYLGSDKELQNLRKICEYAFIGIGFIKNPSSRIRIIKLLKKYSYNIPFFISPLSYFSKTSKTDTGTIIHHNCVINTNVNIGKYNIINTNSLLEHGVFLGDNNHISTGVIINGNSKMGNNNFIGSGSIIYNDIAIGDNCLIAAGSIVKNNLPDHTIYKQ